MHQVFEILSEQPVLFLFILIGIGMAFGHVKIKGISLGAAAVLFFAIALAAWAQSYDIELRATPQLGTLGLTCSPSRSASTRARRSSTTSRPLLARS